MTGMVTPWLYNPNNSQFLKFHFPLQGGRFDPAAGHHSPVWGGFDTIHTISTPRDGCELLPVFNKNQTALGSPDMISRNGADADTRKGSENRKKLPPSAPFFQRHFNHLSI